MGFLGLAQTNQLKSFEAKQKVNSPGDHDYVAKGGY